MEENELGSKWLGRSRPREGVASSRMMPFGRQDTAGELQDRAGKTQDSLVDAVENAEVAEVKRAVFRALTRLRFWAARYK